MWGNRRRNNIPKQKRARTHLIGFESRKREKSRAKERRVDNYSRTSAEQSINAMINKALPVRNEEKALDRRPTKAST